MNKIETKKAVVSFLIAAVVLVSVVGTASAATQYWYLKDTGGAGGADYEMQKGDGHGNTHIVMTDTSKIWRANEPAELDEGVCFGTETWTGIIDYTNERDGGFLDTGETMKLEIGSLSPGGAFTPAMEMTDPGYNAATTVSVAPGSAFTVPKNHYLALRLTVTGTVHVDVDGGGYSSSYIKSPSNDPGYPTPELPTVVLFGTGLLALAGFVLYNRRKENKK